MKKLLVFLFAFVFAICFVNAEGVEVEGSSSQTVKVGDVETPEYSVEVGWTNLVFDWGYLADSGDYGWKAHPVCESHYFADQDEFFSYQDPVYTNDTCTTMADPGFDEENDYYVINKNPDSTVWINDTSEGGAITPSIGFTPSSGYSFTTMSYKYTGMDGQLHNLTDSTLPSAARICAMGGVDEQTGALECDSKYIQAYDVHMYIGIDTTKTITTPTAGATIGTITLTFATN